MLRHDALRDVIYLVTQRQHEAISDKEIVFRFQKDIQSEEGWRLI